MTFNDHHKCHQIQNRSLRTICTLRILYSKTLHSSTFFSGSLPCSLSPYLSRLCVLSLHWIWKRRGKWDRFMWCKFHRSGWVVWSVEMKGQSLMGAKYERNLWLQKNRFGKEWKNELCPLSAIESPISSDWISMHHVIDHWKGLKRVGQKMCQ